jgi:hypothetical protein
VLHCTGPDTVRRHRDARTLQALCFTAQARIQCGVTDTRALCRRYASLHRPGRSAASPRRAHSAGAVLHCAGPDAVRRHRDARTLQALCPLHRSGRSAASPRRAHSAGPLATGFSLKPPRYPSHNAHWWVVHSRGIGPASAQRRLGARWLPRHHATLAQPASSTQSFQHARASPNSLSLAAGFYGGGTGLVCKQPPLHGPLLSFPSNGRLPRTRLAAPLSPTCSVCLPSVPSLSD